MFIYLFFSVLIWQEKLSRTPGGKRRELGIGPSHLHFNEIISNWFIFTHALEILGYSLCPILKTLKSVVSGFGFNTYFLGCFFICHLHCKMIHLSHCDSEYSTLYLHFPVSPLETKPSAPGEWNLLTLGVLSRDESPQFPWLQPLSVPLALNGKAFPYCHLPFWGETQFLRRGIVLWITFCLITSLLQSPSEAPLQRPLELSDYFMNFKWSVQG